MDTIEIEAYRNSKLVTDLDNFRGRYVEKDDVTGNIVVFPSSEIYAYEQNLFRLIAESKKRKFIPRWTMRPDYTSFDIYATVIYWPLILYVNNIYSIEDYTDMSEILTPPVSLINELVRTRVPKKDVQEVDKYIKIPGVKLYERYPFDDIEKSKIQSRENVENMLGSTTTIPTTTLVTTTEVFELTATDITNMYVELTSAPINPSTVSFYIGSFTVAQSYGYDYVLSTGSTSISNRISWIPADCYNGKSRMSNIVKSGTTIKITYLMESTT